MLLEKEKEKLKSLQRDFKHAFFFNYRTKNIFRVVIRGQIFIMVIGWCGQIFIYDHLPLTYKETFE